MINKMLNNNNIIIESESIISKYINMRSGCLNKTKSSTKRNLFGRPNKKLTDKLFFENQLTSQKLVNNFLKQYEIVGEKENQAMNVREEYFSQDFSSSSNCSSDFDKCSFSSTSDNSISNDSSLCSQENCNIMNNNLVNINNEFSNKCDAIRNLIKSSASNNKQTLITDFMKNKKSPQNFLQVNRTPSSLSKFHAEDSFDFRT